MKKLKKKNNNNKVTSHKIKYVENEKELNNRVIFT